MQKISTAVQTCLIIYTRHGEDGLNHETDRRRIGGHSREDPTRKPTVPMGRRASDGVNTNVVRKATTFQTAI